MGWRHFFGVRYGGDGVEGAIVEGRGEDWRRMWAVGLSIGKRDARFLGLISAEPYVRNRIQYPRWETLDDGSGPLSLFCPYNS